MATPVTDEERDKVRALHAEGASMGAIAKELDRPKSTIQTVANELGLQFDRSQTAAATAAKVADNRARRANLVSALYDLAEDDVAYLKQDDGYDLAEVSAGQAVYYTVQRLPAQDRRSLVSSIATALQAAIRTEQVDTDEHGLPAVDAWLRSMLGGGDQ